MPRSVFDVHKVYAIRVVNTINANATYNVLTASLRMIVRITPTVIVITFNAYHGLLLSLAITLGITINYCYCILVYINGYCIYSASTQ